MLVHRRSILQALHACALGSFVPQLVKSAPQPAGPQGADPWTPAQLVEPKALADRLRGSGPKPAVICVAFPVLYRQRHIIGAPLAGPTSSPEGMALLKQVASKLPKHSEIVIYCGCCPMVHCPNIRPAFTWLKKEGYTAVRVLNLPSNFHTDWEQPGYPVVA